MERKEKILTRLASGPGRLKQATGDFLTQIKDFRRWIDGQKKMSVRVMKAYKTTVAEKIDPQIASLRSELNTPFNNSASNLARIVGEIESAVHRPLHMMETTLRPSVGMGAFLERGMRNQTVGDCLKESCTAIDRYVLELTRLIESEATPSSPGTTDRPHSA